MGVTRDFIPIVAIISGSVIAIFAPLVRAFARRMEREHTIQRGSADITERLDRMEHAIDSIAIEVERVSEGQRFTTKLLSEQHTQRLEGDGEVNA